MEQHKKDRLNHLAKKSRIFREFSITPLWNAQTAPERR